MGACTCVCLGVSMYKHPCACICARATVLQQCPYGGLCAACLLKVACMPLISARQPRWPCACMPLRRCGQAWSGCGTFCCRRTRTCPSAYPLTPSRTSTCCRRWLATYWAPGVRNARLLARHLAPLASAHPAAAASTACLSCPPILSHLPVHHPHHARAQHWPRRGSTVKTLKEKTGTQIQITGGAAPA